MKNIDTIKLQIHSTAKDALESKSSGAWCPLKAFKNDNNQVLQSRFKNIACYGF